MKMKEELQRRRVEKGIAELKGGVKQEVKALIFSPDERPSQPKKHKNPLDK